MLGVLVNVVTVLLGTLIGLFAKKGIPEKVEKTVMTGLGLCTMMIGIQGALQEMQALVMIFSVVLGGLVGGALDIDGFINRTAHRVEDHFRKGRSGGASAAEGFVSGTLLFCVGAMTIVGSFNSGLRGDHEMLFTKSLLDFFSSMMLTVSLGFGVGLSAIAVFVIQGGIVLFAGVLEPLLSSAMIAQIASVGSVMILGIGLNLAGIAKIKVANYLPAIVFAPFLCRAAELLPL
ncbi:MAG: DUF554 domain-containing protein [Oscillospiraceae bacterium]|nr:DUF554 domain-containing protein [Oscillospiraceae bacterium]MBR2081328.1 DUF554 domain-containing protein [Oscillospiraceae bacterium]MBR2366852.1 DUF554 domain-containing protein [Oscillospiraceae bacterium]MBR2897269.1 DUF554 domain-containing protein [Oscillospiraceae bacterium]MBR2977097.1 DUF554 domain-containing protein [Oscillospiraceae bacterium]